MHSTAQRHTAHDVHASWYPLCACRYSRLRGNFQPPPRKRVTRGEDGTLLDAADLEPLIDYEDFLSFLAGTKRLAIASPFQKGALAFLRFCFIVFLRALWCARGYCVDIRLVPAGLPCLCGRAGSRNSRVPGSNSTAPSQPRRLRAAPQPGNSTSRLSYGIAVSGLPTDAPGTSNSAYIVHGSQPACRPSSTHTHTHHQHQHHPPRAVLSTAMLVSLISCIRCLLS